MKLRPKNWDSFQHYKDRRPPWIKLHHTLVEDIDFCSLKGEDGKFLVLLWLIASEECGGFLPPNSELAWRLRISEKQVSQLLARLQAWFVFDASKPLDKPEQQAPLEKETETQKLAEVDISPAMIASAVMQEARISGRNLRIVLEEISRNELVAGKTADEVRDAMIRAYQDFQTAKPNLQFVKGLEKFFGEGDWRDSKTWPWKEKRTENPQTSAEWEEFEKIGGKK